MWVAWWWNQTATEHPGASPQPWDQKLDEYFFCWTVAKDYVRRARWIFTYTWNVEFSLHEGSCLSKLTGFKSYAFLRQALPENSIAGSSCLTFEASGHKGSLKQGKACIIFIEAGLHRKEAFKAETRTGFQGKQAEAKTRKQKKERPMNMTECSIP